MAVPPCSGHKRGFQPDHAEFGPEELKGLIHREVDMSIAEPFLKRLRDTRDEASVGPMVVCCYNNKGGVLKSTSCAELGCMFSEMGLNVLLVDLDSQGSLTKGLVELVDPVNDVTFRTRVRDKKVRVKDLDPQPDGQLPEVHQGQPIYYEIYEGLTEIVRPNLPNLLPVPVTPVKLRSRNAKVLYDTTKLKRAKVSQDLQETINLSRISSGQEPTSGDGTEKLYPQGSLHLVLGHHNTSRISNCISVAMSAEQDPRLQRIHGSINYLIRQAATDVQADLVLVDLNPDASELNRTVLMQSDYILVPTWADSDGIECVVDLRTRLVQGLTKASAGESEDRGEYFAENKHAWIQVHQNLIERTHTPSVIPEELKQYRVRPSFPKFLGLMVHSRESNRSIKGEVLVDFLIRIEQKFVDLCECLQPREKDLADSQEHKDPTELKKSPSGRLCALAASGGQAHLFYKAGTAQRYTRLCDNPSNKVSPGRSRMDATGDPQVVNHGGIWNHQVLKTLAKNWRKPISMIDFDDLKEVQESQASGASVNTNLMQIAEHRVRMFNICKSVLHNLQRDRYGGIGIPNFFRED